MESVRFEIVSTSLLMKPVTTATVAAKYFVGSSAVDYT